LAETISDFPLTMAKD